MEGKMKDNSFSEFLFGLAILVGVYYIFLEPISSSLLTNTSYVSVRNCISMNHKEACESYLAAIKSNQPHQFVIMNPNHGALNRFKDCIVYDGGAWSCENMIAHEYGGGHGKAVMNDGVFESTILQPIIAPAYFYRLYSLPEITYEAGPEGSIKGVTREEYFQMIREIYSRQN